MLYREIIAVCSEIHKKHIHALCGRNVELLSVKSGVTYSYRRFIALYEVGLLTNWDNSVITVAGCLTKDGLSYLSVGGIFFNLLYTCVHFNQYRIHGALPPYVFISRCLKHRGVCIYFLLACIKKYWICMKLDPEVTEAKLVKQMLKFYAKREGDSYQNITACNTSKKHRAIFRCQQAVNKVISNNITMRGSKPK